MDGRKLRIGIIAPPWASVPPFGYGGTEAVIDRLARGFRDLGHDVVLFATGDSTCPVDRRWVFDRSQPDAIGNAVTEIEHVVHAYDAFEHMDVVHDHSNVGPLYAWRFPTLPVVATNHGPFNDALNAMYRGAEGRVALVAISHHQASTAAVPIDAVIHHGLDVGAFPNGSGDGDHFLFLGRMAPEKGAEQAARAARRAGVRLLMAAKLREPSENEYFDDRVRPLLGAGVEYLGEVTHDEKLALLAGARGLLNPIQWPEPFGLVMIEALACGTPVLAFPNGAAPEIVEHGQTGFLCADTNMMSRRINDVDGIDRQACREAVARRFSTSKMCTEYLTVFDQARRRSLQSPHQRPA